MKQFMNWLSLKEKIGGFSRICGLNKRHDCVHHFWCLDPVNKDIFVSIHDYQAIHGTLLHFLHLPLNLKVALGMNHEKNPCAA